MVNILIFRTDKIGDFLISCTTFSTFGLETFEMLKSGQLKLSTIYVLGSMLIGLAAVFLGMSISK